MGSSLLLTSIGFFKREDQGQVLYFSILTTQGAFVRLSSGKPLQGGTTWAAQGHPITVKLIMGWPLAPGKEGVILSKVTITSRHAFPG